MSAKVKGGYQESKAQVIRKRKTHAPREAYRDLGGERKESSSGQGQ